MYCEKCTIIEFFFCLNGEFNENGNFGKITYRDTTKKKRM